MSLPQKIMRSEKLKGFLYSEQGKFLRPFHTALIQTMVQGLIILHRKRFGTHRDPAMDRDVTVVVKTFLRPKTARRFVKNCRQVFGGQIIVVDDSPEPVTIKDSGVEVLRLPFNSGISVGRNTAVAKVTTPYTLISDDDHIFTCASMWDIAYEYLEKNPQVDGVAASVVEIPKWYVLDLNSSGLYLGAANPIYPAGTEIDGYKVAAKTANVFLARTDSLRKIPWDNELKLLEHTDFFSAAAGKLTFVQADDIPVYHARTPWNKTYTRYRDSTKIYARYNAQKWAKIAAGHTKPQGH